MLKTTIVVCEINKLLCNEWIFLMTVMKQVRKNEPEIFCTSFTKGSQFWSSFFHILFRGFHVRALSRTGLLPHSTRSCLGGGNIHYSKQKPGASHATELQRLSGEPLSSRVFVLSGCAAYFAALHGLTATPSTPPDLLWREGGYAAGMYLWCVGVLV